MNAVIRACVLVVLLAHAPASGASEGVARVLGAEITQDELEAAGDATARVARFRDWVWERVSGHYIVEQGLAATAGDIAEFVAYHREFERKDRLQRARKLEELNGRLAAGDLDSDERLRLEEFRKILVRMAERDAQSERVPEDSPRSYAPWIEFWKANGALYRQYGGTVAATASGPVAHGARAALVADYERRGLVRFLDPALRAQLFELMSRAPDVIVPPGRVDFTPYWTLPVPPSYFPE